MDFFNNREIASFLWLSVIFIYMSLKQSSRNRLIKCIKPALVKPLMVLVVIYIMYVLIEVYVLMSVSWWRIDQLKNTILWSLLLGLGAVGKSIEMRQRQIEPYFKEWVLANLKITGLIEYITTLKSFSLAFEVILQPIILVCLYGSLRRNDKSKKVYGAVLSLIGLTILVYGLSELFNHKHVYYWEGIYRDFLTPIFLSVMLVPFLYCLHLYTSYERVLNNLRYPFKDNTIRAYAKKQALINFKWDIDALERWYRHVMILNHYTQEDIDSSIQHIKDVKKREKYPPILKREEGWLPNKARYFLKEYNIVAGDYHSQGDEWFCSAPPLEFDETDFLKNNVSYFLNGHKRAVVQLILKLNINVPTLASSSEKRFNEIATILLNKAVMNNQGEWCKFLSNENSEILINGLYKVQIMKENWTSGIPNGYNRKLIITIQ